MSTRNGALAREEEARADKAQALADKERALAQEAKLRERLRAGD